MWFRSFAGLVLVLVVVVEVVQGQQQCYYSLDMKFGSDYYLPSPQFPLFYPPNTQCSYRINAPFGYRINFTCDVFQIPSSTGCKIDAVYISPSGREDLADAYTYCGAGTVQEKSFANSLLLRLRSSPTSRGGKFLCRMSLIQPSCSCGRKKQTRIVNGVQTAVNEFPMMAAMIDVKTKSVVCGATIISERFALTAAHCLLNRNVDDTVLLVGDHNLTTGADTSYAQAYVLAQFIGHPGFTMNPVANDIALLRTLQPIQFNAGVGPVCLPWKFRGASFSGDSVEACGWGNLDFGGPSSNVLMKVDLNVIDNQDCSSRLNSVMSPQKMCTYTPTKDTCQADSGGPLYFTEAGSGRLYEVGIVSYGYACATTKPSVNTRVTEYLDWIMASSPDSFYCFM
ncbi:hypothetical protein quinque_005840 [Culex quinquefasciatus]